MSGTANGQPGPIGSMVSVSAEVEWHLREIAGAISDAAVPISQELLRIVLAGLAEVVRRVVARQGEVSAAPPILFRDHIVSEAAHMWERRIREAMRQAADTDRHHQAEQAGEPS